MLSFVPMVYAEKGSLNSPLRHRWVTKLKKEKLITLRPFQFTVPAIGENHIYVGAASGYFYALNKKTGHKDWTAKLATAVYAEPVFDDAAVYVADRKGTIYALNKTDGKVLWQFDTGAEISSRPLLTADAIYVTTMTRQLIAIDREGRGRKWLVAQPGQSSQMTIKGSSSPVLYNGNIYVGYSDGTIVCHRTSDGSIVWSKPLTNRAARFTDVDSTPLIVNNVLYVSTLDDKTYALNPANGDMIWVANGGGPNDITPDAGRLYVAGNGRVVALDINTGKPLWEQDLKEPELSTPALKDGVLVVFSTKDKMYMLDANTGAVKFSRFLGKGTFGRPIIEDDVLYVLTNSSSLFSFKW